MNTGTYNYEKERVAYLLNIINNINIDEAQKYLDYRLGIAKARGNSDDILVYGALNQLISEPNNYNIKRR